MDSACKYTGEFVVLPLSKFVKPGRGDDVVVVVDHEKKSPYGCLDIEFYEEDFELACKLAMMEEGRMAKEPIMIAVQDPESGSPMVLAKRVMRDGERRFLAIIFNASFSYPEDSRRGSYCLRMTDVVDPKGVFSERIMYSPGENILWEPDQLKMLELDE